MAVAAARNSQTSPIEELLEGIKKLNSADFG